MSGVWVRVSRCDVPGMLAGAMEVEARSESGTGLTYYVGYEEQHGETVVRPVDSRGLAVGPDWQIDGCMLDALEYIQAGAGCRFCNETGKAESIQWNDPADVREVDCEACDGQGWREA